MSMSNSRISKGPIYTRRIINKLTYLKINL